MEHGTILSTSIEALGARFRIEQTWVFPSRHCFVFVSRYIFKCIRPRAEEGDGSSATHLYPGLGAGRQLIRCCGYAIIVGFLFARGYGISTGIVREGGNRALQRKAESTRLLPSSPNIRLYTHIKKCTSLISSVVSRHKPARPPITLPNSPASNTQPPQPKQPPKL